MRELEEKMNTDETKLTDLENTDTSFAKLGTNGEILIVCFASNAHSGFEWKTTLLEIRRNILTLTCFLCVIDTVGI